MINPDILETLQNSSVEERIALIEAILQSLKNDIAKTAQPKTASKPFKVRTFSLGEEVNISREEIHAERNI